MPTNRGASGSRRRESFDEVADSYDLFRPAPPETVVDAMVSASGVRAGSLVLEIGCGTGQLSVPLAERGVELVAVELGSNLAAIARRNLERFPNARVEVGSFDEWEPPDQELDAVMCASAFHWLDPEIRYTKCARALRRGGALAILHVHHVRGGTPGFFADTQPIYRRWGLSDDTFVELPDPNTMPDAYPELDERAEFDEVERHRFEIARRHTAASYVGWLRTDSLVNSVDRDSRRAFLGEIEDLITSSYGGSVERNFLYEVIVARRA
jgi:SAM-dependent methyltransferase